MSKDLKKATKDRDNTFLVFQSGMVIMSGMVAEIMEDDYYKFIKLVIDGRQNIEEKLDTSDIVLD